MRSGLAGTAESPPCHYGDASAAFTYLTTLCAASISSESALHRFLELLGGAERDLLAGLDLDRFAGGRIAAHAGGALFHLQDTEAADADAVALFEVLDHHAAEVIENEFGLLFRHFVA